MQARHLLPVAFLALTILPLLAGPTDTLKLLGTTKAEVLERYGLPEKTLGPETGYQTYEYPPGLSIVLHKDKVVQYIAKDDSRFRTEKDIRIGSDLTEVTRAYGDYTATEAVTEWFGGRKQNVLYHHPGHDRYKLNYARNDVIFLLDSNKKVESIWVGYIFPKE